MKFKLFFYHCLACKKIYPIAVKWGERTTYLKGENEQNRRCSKCGKYDTTFFIREYNFQTQKSITEWIK